MILAVDDDPDMLRVLRRALAPVTSKITTTEDPLIALDLLSQHPFDILISDIDMPLMSGHELMRQARSVRPDVVRILLTGRATLDSAMRAINEGEVHRYLSKPFDAKELRAIVSGALERRAELARAGRVAAEADRQLEVVTRLESRYPGLSRLDRDAEGAYRLAPARATAGAQAARSLGLLLLGGQGGKRAGATA